MRPTQTRPPPGTSSPGFTSRAGPEQPERPEHPPSACRRLSAAGTRRVRGAQGPGPPRRLPTATGGASPSSPSPAGGRESVPSPGPMWGTTRDPGAASWIHVKHRSPETWWGGRGARPRPGSASTGSWASAPHPGDLRSAAARSTSTGSPPAWARALGSPPAWTRALGSPQLSSYLEFKTQNKERNKTQRQTRKQPQGQRGAGRAGVASSGSPRLSPGTPRSRGELHGHRCLFQGTPWHGFGHRHLPGVGRAGASGLTGRPPTAAGPLVLGPSSLAALTSGGHLQGDDVTHGRPRGGCGLCHRWGPGAASVSQGDQAGSPRLLREVTHGRYLRSVARGHVAERGRQEGR